MGEKMREKCLSTVEHEKTLIDNEFPKQKYLNNFISRKCIKSIFKNDF